LQAVWSGWIIVHNHFRPARNLPVDGSIQRPLARRPGISWRLHEALRFAERVMMEPVEIILRLGSATLIGAAIGVNRDLRGKPIGVRTLGLVGLVSAAAILAITYAGTDPRADAPSRVMQGVLTGIGFLGAGVIVRGR
jgi:hypothetical protein